MELSFKEIITKVEERERTIAFKKRCKRVFVCPNCGGDLDHSKHSKIYFGVLQCTKCKGIF